MVDVDLLRYLPRHFRRREFANLWAAVKVPPPGLTLNTTSMQYLQLLLDDGLVREVDTDIFEQIGPAPRAGERWSRA